MDRHIKNITVAEHKKQLQTLEEKDMVFEMEKSAMRNNSKDMKKAGFDKRQISEYKDVTKSKLNVHALNLQKPKKLTYKKALNYIEEQKSATPCVGDWTLVNETVIQEHVEEIVPQFGEKRVKLEEFQDEVIKKRKINPNRRKKTLITD